MLEKQKQHANKKSIRNIKDYVDFFILVDSCSRNPISLYLGKNSLTSGTYIVSGPEKNPG